MVSRPFFAAHRLSAFLLIGLTMFFLMVGGSEAVIVHPGVVFHHEETNSSLVTSAPLTFTEITRDSVVEASLGAWVFSGVSFGIECSSPSTTEINVSVHSMSTNLINVTVISTDCQQAVFDIAGLPSNYSYTRFIDNFPFDVFYTSEDGIISYQQNESLSDGVLITFLHGDITHIEIPYSLWNGTAWLNGSSQQGPLSYCLSRYSGCSPVYQTSDKGIYNVTNPYGHVINLYAKVNATQAGWTPKMGTANNHSMATNITTERTLIHESLGAGESKNLWLWFDTYYAWSSYAFTLIMEAGT